MAGTPALVGNGTLSCGAESRLALAAQLYHQKPLPIIVSGGQVYSDSGNEAQIAKREFSFLGIPEKDVIIEDNKYKFTKGDGRHTIFGYLQIDKILHPKYDKVPEEFNKHPHVYDSKRKEKDTDTIYIAKDVCTFDNNIKGYGIFKYDEKLDLTKKGMNRTCWDLPDFFKGVKIAYHNENSFKEGYFKSACRGQEFVIEDNKDVEEWAINLIKEHSTNRIK